MVRTSKALAERDDDPDGQGWSIAERTVLLDQSVVLSKNLSVFL